MELSDRQKEIIDIVKKKGPITGFRIAAELGISRATIRPDLTILTMVNLLGARPKVGYFYTGKSQISILIDKLKDLRIEDFMSLPIVMDEKTSIYDVIVGLFLEDISSVFITDEGFLAGVVSRKDLLRTTLGSMDIKSTPVGLIMTRMPNIITIESRKSVLEAASLMQEKAVEALPVVENEEDGLKVVGKFTKTNINRLFVDICNNEVF